MKAAARKVKGKYKAVIDHGWRTEVIGTRWRPTEDLRDQVIARGAPRYDVRQDALDHAQRVIDFRLTRRAKVCA